MFFRELETDRLVLKNIALDDRAFILTQFSNPIVNRYLFDAEPIADLQGAEDIIRYYTQPEPRTHHRWVLVRKEDGAKIGTCGFHCWDAARRCCDAGYDLLPEYWGNGYMGEAMKAILAFAQGDMKIERVHACIYPGNPGSVRLAERLGFAFKGQMKDEVFRGASYPHRIYELDLPSI